MAAPTVMRAAGCSAHRPALATIPKPCRAIVPSPFQGVAARRSVLARAEGVKKPAYEFDTDNLVSDLKEKWDALEDKPTVITYGAGALVVLWVASGVVSVVNSIPLVPKAMELVGLVYSAWFVYRYLLFKSSREELLADIESLKEKISGDSGTY